MRAGALASVFINTNISKAEDAVYPQSYVSGVAAGKFILTHRVEKEEKEIELTEEEQNELWEKTKRRLMAFAGKRLGTEEEIAAKQAAK